MSKRARHRRKCYRHRYIKNMGFGEFIEWKYDAQKCSRAIDVSVLMFHYKYVQRIEPEITKKEWKVRTKLHRRPKTHKTSDYFWPIRSINGGTITLPNSQVQPGKTLRIYTDKLSPDLNTAIGKLDPLNSRGIPERAVVELFGFNQAVATATEKVNEFLNAQIIPKLLENHE